MRLLFESSLPGVGGVKVLPHRKQEPKNLGHFRTKKAATKLSYLALRAIIQKWKKGQMHWRQRQEL